ncbi:Twinkle protein, mitochondrial [Trichinella pseudospiralis]|uniref:Twinkle protein, mitochondrial n=1 Tax=Trichinella pseudospiralis TaxID=6337 RepID=A0A0V1F9I0_TRIPS|nr:Twinkle protein, mitochondrial [Trichinella pseudospiralis]
MALVQKTAAFFSAVTGYKSKLFPDRRSRLNHLKHNRRILQRRWDENKNRISTSGKIQKINSESVLSNQQRNARELSLQIYSCQSRNLQIVYSLPKKYGKSYDMAKNGMRVSKHALSISPILYYLTFSYRSFSKWQNRFVFHFAHFTNEKNFKCSTLLFGDIANCLPDELWNDGLSVEMLSSKEWHKLTSAFTQKHITRRSFQKYQVRISKDKNAMIFPSFTHFGEECYPVPVSVKLVSLTDFKEIPLPGLFGFNLIMSISDVVVLALSEWEAMFLFEKSGLPVVVLPKNCLQFENEVAHSSLIKGLSIYDYYTRSSKSEVSVPQCLAQSMRMLHPCISPIGDLRSTVFDYIYRQGVTKGIAQWNRFHILNSYLGGLRLGELTIVSGPTGCGKTTFISLYSLDLCEQLDKQINTLWCSFEVSTARLVHVMMQQLNCRKIDETIPERELEIMYNKLSLLPLYFTKFNGSFEFREVVEAIEHHVEIYDIRHVVVDNLQFLAGAVDQMISDRFTVQDRVFSEFRRIATERNVHLTLVVHPRKELDSGQLSLNSLYGGVKASQEADNVYVLQVKREFDALGIPKIHRYFQILKNRRMGELEMSNRLELKFNHDTVSHRIVRHVDPVFIKGKTAP